MRFVSDRTSQPEPLYGREAFAALLRKSIPNYGEHGSLQSWLDSRGLAADMTSSELGRYTRGEVVPATDRVRLLARGMNRNFEYVRGVLEGTEEPTDDPPLAGDVVMELAELLERAAALANRLTIQHAQSMRARRPRRPKKGAPNHTSLNVIDAGLHVFSTSASS